MPKKFIFKVNNVPQFEDTLYTGRCLAHTKKGTRCKRHCIIGYEYCYSHLESEMELKIKDSTIPQAQKGLFAFNKKKEPNDIIFRKDEEISQYNGENIHNATRNQRYGQYNAPYGLQITNDNFIDSALKRGVGSLANTRNNGNNARFSVNTRNRTAKIIATKPIRNNTEIFVPYGRSYRLNEPNVSFQTKNTR